MKKRYLLATVGILLAFAIGLVGYFAFPASGGDGLEKMMENAGIEPNHTYNAPLSYGNGYISALLAGIIGFSATLGVVYGYLRISKRLKNEKG